MDRSKVKMEARKKMHIKETWGQNISEESDESSQQGLGEGEMKGEIDESDGSLPCAVPLSTDSGTINPSYRPLPHSTTPSSSSSSFVEVTTSDKNKNHTGKGSDLRPSLEGISREIKEERWRLKWNARKVKEQRRKLKRHARKLKEEKEKVEWHALRIKEEKRKLKRNARRVKKEKQKMQVLLAELKLLERIAR